MCKSTGYTGYTVYIHLTNTWTSYRIFPVSPEGSLMPLPFKSDPSSKTSIPIIINKFCSSMNLTWMELIHYESLKCGFGAQHSDWFVHVVCRNNPVHSCCYIMYSLVLQFVPSVVSGFGLWCPEPPWTFCCTCLLVDKSIHFCGAVGHRRFRCM